MQDEVIIYWKKQQKPARSFQNFLTSSLLCSHVAQSIY